MLYDDPQIFIDNDDRNALRMTSSAASKACELAADAGLLVITVEGGRWLNPGVEAWRDCIWWGELDIHAYDAAHAANLKAAKFIVSETGIERPGGMGTPDVFILTAKRYGLETPRSQ
ncbi:MAG: hypothetical protein KF780_12990 [Sphingomonas sp.]|nr:hypothetical protein [Sphingomonas sp.]